VNRGAIVVVAAKGASTGKPRPALVVQSDLFNPTHHSGTLCPDEVPDEVPPSRQPSDNTGVLGPARRSRFPCKI
jgi:mRNA-degrading endonuclease toxin of MazEF toxin-antitoxin module